MNNKSEEKKRTEQEEALIKKKNNRVYYFLFFTPVFVSVIAYFYFFYFGESNTFILDSLPKFMQEFGVVKENANVFLKDRNYVMANNYVINYYFGLTFILLVALISSKFDLFTRGPGFKPTAGGSAYIFVSLGILFFIYAIFFREGLFRKDYRMSWMMRAELFGMAFYSLASGSISFLVAGAFQGIRYIRKEASDANRRNRRL